MTGALRDGRQAWASGSPLLMGSNSEIRGFLASILIDHGFDPQRLPKVIAARRSQLYNDRKAAARVGLIGGPVGGHRADVIAFDEAGDLEDEAA